MTSELPLGLFPPGPARDTLGGAVAVAAELPAGLQSELLGIARNAFTDGLVLIAVVSAAAVLIAALAVTLLLRTKVPGSSPASAE